MQNLFTASAGKCTNAVNNGTPTPDQLENKPYFIFTDR